MGIGGFGLYSEPQGGTFNFRTLGGMNQKTEQGSGSGFGTEQQGGGVTRPPGLGGDSHSSSEGQKVLDSSM